MWQQSIVRMIEIRSQSFGKRGFSILEIMIAMAIAVIAISGVIMATGPSGGSAQNISGDQSSIVSGETNAEAIQKAQALLESAQALARQDFGALVVGVTAGSGGIYNWTRDVQTPDPSNPDIKRVTSTVTWTLGSRMLSTKLSTLVANVQNGPQCIATLSAAPC